MHRFTCKHGSDHNVLCCQDSLSHLAIDASSYVKVMHITGEGELTHV